MAIRSSIASSLAIAAAAAASVVYAPIGCGCMTPGEDFTRRFDVPKVALQNPVAPDIALIESSISQELRGASVSLATLPGLNACAKLTPVLYRCTYWLWQAPGRERGVEVSLSLDDSGVFKSVNVFPALRIGTPKAPGSTEQEDTET